MLTKSMSSIGNMVRRDNSCGVHLVKSKSAERAAKQRSELVIHFLMGGLENRFIR